MYLNEKTSISTSTVLLVPYSPHHVPTYHKWMQDEELQAATASEPLTLNEEYDMQRSWRTDRDKLTFIVCLPLNNGLPSVNSVQGGVDDVSDRMVGDINLFLFEPTDDDDEAEEGSIGPTGDIVGEIELMIARKDLHRRGYGRASLLAFIDYVLTHWEGIQSEYRSGDPNDLERRGLAYLRVKINQNNFRSMLLFESIGFQKVTESANYFGEVELRWQGRSHDLASSKDWEASTVRPYSEMRRQEVPEHPCS